MTALSSACNECRNLLGGYVLDALEPGETELVRTHLATCADCATEYEQLRSVPHLLDIAGAEETAYEAPPAALEEVVLDHFAREHRTRAREPRMPFWDWVAGARRRLSRPLPAALAGAVAAAAITAAILVLPATSNRTTEVGDTYQATLTASPLAQGATANAQLVTFSSGTRVRLHVQGLRGNPDSLYELWCLRDDGSKVSAGTFRVDANGNADVSLTTAAVPGEYHRLGVERRTLTGPDQPGQRVMGGDIQYVHA